MSFIRDPDAAIVEVLRRRALRPRTGDIGKRAALTLRRACRAFASREQTPLDGVVRRMLDRQLTLDDATEVFQRRYVLHAAESCGGHCGLTAHTLGMHRNSFSRLLLRLGLPKGCRRGLMEPVADEEHAA